MQEWLSKAAIPACAHLLRGNHPKQAGLTWPKQRNRRGLSLRFLVVIRQRYYC